MDILMRQLKAEELLRRIEKNDDLTQFKWGVGHGVPIPRRGEWMKLGLVYNIGQKTILWLVDNGFLIKRGSGRSYKPVINDWYKLASAAAAHPHSSDDYGDLWIE